MSEVPATVESEFVPEPKWPERIIVCHARTLDGMGDFDLFVPRVSENAEDEAKGWCNSQGYTAYRILRVAPPVERRVSIDWEAVVKEVHGAFNKLKGIGNLGVVAHELRGHVLQELIQRHARIVEVSKP